MQSQFEKTLKTRAERLRMDIARVSCRMGLWPIVTWLLILSGWLLQPVKAQEFQIALPPPVPGEAATATFTDQPQVPAAAAAPPTQAPKPTAPEVNEIDAQFDLAADEDPSSLMAIVSHDHIIYGDIRHQADTYLRQMVGNQKVPAEELRQARKMIMRKVLVDTINTKVVFRAFIDSVAGSETPEKAREAEKQVQTKALRYFYEQEVPKQMRDRKVNTLVELEDILRKKGTSLERLKSQFVEVIAGSMYMREQIPQEPLVTPVEQLDFYKEHATDFDKPARARWEQMSVLFERFGSRDEAYAQIVSMGNEALFGGNMQAVAKKSSQEPFASKNGVHDWTRKGSLRSKQLDGAIFSLELNKMSAIIEDDVGYHIVRVLEREEARRLPFSEVQEEIKKKIQLVKREEMHDKLLKKMREKIPVYSLYPNDYPGSMPLNLVADVTMPEPDAPEKR